MEKLFVPANLVAIALAFLLSLTMACSSKGSKPTQSTPTPAPTKTKAQAQPTSGADSATGITCVHGSDKRTVAVAAKDAGCEVMYTKMDDTKSVASSVHGTKHCEDVAAKIEKHLTESGYTCQ